MRVGSALGLLLALLVTVGCGGRGPSNSSARSLTEPPASATAIPQVKPEPPPALATPEPKAVQTPSKPPRPDPELNGAIGVMVENSWGARPQAGLDLADVIYELESEYGITRFLAFFYSFKAAKIGPVRSARMGFYEIAKGYGLPFGHAGGNPDVLDVLYRDEELPDLDDIYTCGTCFWRSDDRKAPHNLYTSTDLLGEHAQERGHKPAQLYLHPQGDLPAGNPASSVKYSWGPETQDAAWQWDGKRYLRSQSGAPHRVESGAQIGADNLILFWTRYVWVHKGEWQHDVTITGSGDGYLFRDGQVYPLTWQKTDSDSHFRFTLKDGSDALLAPGQTWVSILKSDKHLSFGE